MIAVWIAILFCLAWLGFAFVGYPLALWLLRAVSPRPIRSGEAVPEITLVIAVHNGERDLERKLGEAVALDYPKPFEILVASDGSTDRTEGIARSFADCGVRLVALPVRGGKEAATDGG